jgi:Tol biopolymer transport system component
MPPRGSLLLAAVSLSVVVVASAIERDAGTRVYFEAGRRWFEDPAANVSLSNDGRWALLMRWDPSPRLVSLATGHDESPRLREGLDAVRSAVHCGNDAWARLGSRGTERGWFLPEPGGVKLSRVPADARLACSSGGTHIAYFRQAARETELFVGTRTSQTRTSIGGDVCDVAFAGDTGALFALAEQPDGTATLLRIRDSNGQPETLRRGLDAACPYARSLAVVPDGRILYLSLAGEGRPNDEARQKPDAPRWLAIYRFDVESDRLTKVLGGASDLFSPVVAGDQLLYATNAGKQSVVVLPVAGGAGREVVAGAQHPIWSSDGRRLGFTIGDWRLADWALNLDGGVVGLDATLQAVGAVQPLIVGNHEDFSPVWSPDGKWIAYHSHRSEKPVASYDAQGSTDDIWLRSATARHPKEIRLTDTGWEVGSPDWAPDSRRMVYCGWERGAPPRTNRCWILAIDPETGRALSSKEIPLSAGMDGPAWAAWSPAGNEIALETHGRGEERALWVVNADGGNPRRMIAYRGTTYGGVDWAPDGKTIVYAGLDGDRMQIFAVSPTGGEPHRISQDSATLLHPQVSPDGRWIAATRIEFRKEIWKRPI